MPRRVTVFCDDPDYHKGRSVEVTLDGAFFRDGMVLIADELQGLITFIPTSEEGFPKFDRDAGAWAQETVRGVVRIYDEPDRARPC